MKKYLENIDKLKSNKIFDLYIDFNNLEKLNKISKCYNDIICLNSLLSNDELKIKYNLCNNNILMNDSKIEACIKKNQFVESCINKNNDNIKKLVEERADSDTIKKQLTLNNALRDVLDKNYDLIYILVRNNEIEKNNKVMVDNLLNDSRVNLFTKDMELASDLKIYTYKDVINKDDLDRVKKKFYEYNRNNYNLDLLNVYCDYLFKLIDIESDLYKDTYNASVIYNTDKESDLSIYNDKIFMKNNLCRIVNNTIKDIDNNKNDLDIGDIYNLMNDLNYVNDVNKFIDNINNSDSNLVYNRLKAYQSRIGDSTSISDKMINNIFKCLDNNLDFLGSNVKVKKK